MSHRSRLTHWPSSLKAIVLAGDPERDARLALLDALTHAGFRVRLAGTGVDLLREAHGDGVDVVVCATHLLSANGGCAIQALKVEPELRHIRVIAYSESSAPGDEAWAKSAGADAFLRDPANLAALFDTVASLLPVKSMKSRIRDLIAAPEELAPA